MKKLQWVSGVDEVENLQSWLANPRDITSEGFDRLVEKIRVHGFHSAIVVDHNNIILSGNQRKDALIKLGIKEVMVLRPNRPLTEDEREKIALESNLNDGQWNTEKLKLLDLGNLEFAGFDKIELAKIWDDGKDVPQEKFDVEKELKKIKVPKIKLNDIICLGSHRVICQDSTKIETLEKLFGKEKASMIYSDPIYNLEIDYSGGIGGKQNYGGSVNDSRTFDEYKKFLKDSMECALAVSKKDIHVFYWCDQVYIGVVQDIYRSLGIANKRVTLWLKNSQNPVPSVAFNKCYEPCVYGARGKVYLAKSITNLNEVMNKEMTTGNNLHDEVERFIDIWMAKRLSAKEYEHSTTKPAQLHEKAIKRCTQPNDIILDSFLGSGSTLIAGETLGRRVYGCELEPIYCDLIIRRWEKLTGRKAKIIRDEKV